MTPNESPRSLGVLSLFSGIGGGDIGLERAGHRVLEMCESWDPARAVLEARFPGVHVAPDVRTYVPAVEFGLLSAGFPCVDLSHAGSQAGIFGPQSGLVDHVFRIAEANRPEWILIENVPNLLRLQRGAGIRHIIGRLEALGYSWAYRVVDSRSFGVPQRRNRVILLATLNGDAAAVLLADDSDGAQEQEIRPASAASGFYWTEGRRGVGLVADAIPTLKGGSTLGLPSAPAVWLPNEKLGKRIVLPSIEDAEVLQGLPRGWTAPADRLPTAGRRWKLVGNAITVGVAEWIGRRLAGVPETVSLDARPYDAAAPWPDAAFGSAGQIWTVSVSRLPFGVATEPLGTVLNHDSVKPLSYRATRGFLNRIEESGLGLPPAFVRDLESHLAFMRSHDEKKNLQVTSWASSPGVRARMQRTHGKNTKPEQRLREALTRAGVRYRLQVRPESDLRWRSDFVFIGPKLAVEVRGCFWHACPVHQTWPKANAERWAEKLNRNRARDARMEVELAARGWTVLVVWEHEEADEAAQRVVSTLDGLKSQKSKSS